MTDHSSEDNQNLDNSSPSNDDGTHDTENVPMVIHQHPVPVKQSTAEHPKTGLDWFHDRITSEIPPPWHFDGSYILDTKGQPLCGPILVDADLMTTSGRGAALIVRFINRRGLEDTQILSHVDLGRGNGGKSIEDLIDAGFPIFGNIASFVKLLRRWQPNRTGFLAVDPGYVEENDDLVAFVCQDGSVLKRRADAVPLIAVQTLGSMAGKQNPDCLQGWCHKIGRYAVGNPNLMFSISAAAAAPLLRWTGLNVAAFLFYGAPGTGKTTLLKCAESVMSGPKKTASWFATDTAIEAVMNDSRDGLAVIDEFPKTVDRKTTELLYSITNASGRGRSNRNLDRLEQAQWRSIVMISGEKSIEQTYADSRQGMPEGLGGRIINVPIISGGHGCFDDLHDFSSAREMAEALGNSAHVSYGHVGKVIPERLLKSNVARDIMWKCRQVVRRDLALAAGWHDGSLDGLQTRLLDRMSLVALAGELLSRWCPELGWPQGAAVSAVTEIMLRLVDAETSPERIAFDHVFDSLSQIVPESDASPLVPILDEDRLAADGDEMPAGWFDAEYLFLTPDFFNRTLSAGIGGKAAIDVLKQTGVLVPGGERNSDQYKLPRRKVSFRPRCYRLCRKSLTEYV